MSNVNSGLVDRKKKSEMHRLGRVTLLLAYAHRLSSKKAYQILNYYCTELQTFSFEPVLADWYEYK